jgi:hypothetical protein
MNLEQLVGAAVVLIFLADIFLTVLYARAGTSLIARYVNRAAWQLISAVSGLLRRSGGRVLSLGGPIIVVLVILTWAVGLTLGAGLIMQPLLGSSVKPSSGSTPHDFMTAWFVGANSMSIVSAGDYSPHTAATRLLFMFNALAGASALSLTLSYLIQVYSALRERNAVALTVDMMSDCTGDAARALARLGADGKFEGGYSELANLASSLAGLKEAHHFYPLLFYFRFRDERYSVSRVCFVILDLVTLMSTALDQEQFGWLVRSSAVARLRHGSELLLQVLEVGLPTRAPSQPQDEQLDRMREHYAACCRELQASGLQTSSGGAETYVAERMKWERRIVSVAPVLGYSMEDVTGIAAA